MYVHSSPFIFDWIFFIRLGNKNNHKCLDEFECQVEPTSDWS